MAFPDKVNVLPLRDPGTPYAVDYDEQDKKVLWSDIKNGKIHRSCLNGSHQESIETNVIGKLNGLKTVRAQIGSCWSIE